MPRGAPSALNGAAYHAPACQSCGGSTDRRVDERPVVTIFGAGIAGLSAAHELVERNFIVQVVEPSEHRTKEGECDVGGIAATQYGELLRRGATLRPQDGGDAEGASGVGVLGQGGALSAGMRPLSPAVDVPQRIWFPFARSTEDVRYDSDLSFEALRPRDRPVRGTRGGVLAIHNGEKLDRVVEQLTVLSQMHPRETPVVEVRGYVEDSLPGETARAISLKQAELVCAALRSRRDFPSRVVLEPFGLGTTEPAGDNRYEEGRRRNNRVELRVRSVLIPGDHGYRFFPAFYWNLDDTMGRIPLFRDGEETGGTTLDHLKSANVVSLDFADGRSSIAFPRRRIRSFEELRKLINELQAPLGYSPRDMALYQLKLFEFMTSGRRRRRYGTPDGSNRKSLEEMSWYEYVTGASPEDARSGSVHASFSAPFLRDLTNLPKAMAGMSGTESDAHTSGNIHLQLLLDQLGDGTRVDRLLDGPTSEQWFDHWKTYLRHQGVRFFVGAFDGFQWCETCEELRPHAVGVRYGKLIEGAAPFPAPVFEDEVEAEIATDPASAYRSDADFFVLGAPLHVAKDAACRLDRAHPGVLEGALADLVSYDVGDAYAPRSGPPAGGQLRDMSGLQFYFENDFTFARGHIYYVQSAWSLTSISQLQFWRDRRTSASGYLGILSVDLGEMHRADDSEPVLAALLTANCATRIDRLLDSRAGAESASDPVLDAMAELARRSADAAWRVASSASEIIRGQPEEEPRWRELAAVLSNLLTRPLLPPNEESIDTLFALARAELPEDCDSMARAAADWLDEQQPLTPHTPLSRYSEHVTAWKDALAIGLEALAESHARDRDGGVEDDPLPSGLRALREAAIHVYDAARTALTGKCAWSSTRQEIADTVWRQIKTCLDPESAASVPEPLWFRTDDMIEFGPLPTDPDRPADWPVRNRAPYHITAVGGFDARPGVLPGETHPFFEVANKRWLPIGNYVKTHTRIASMEQSNESARHAVRTIIDRILRSDPARRIYRAAGKRLGDLPRFYDPEDHELQDLSFLRRVDDLLYDDGLPHMVEIVKLRQALFDWMPGESGDHPLSRLADVLGAIQQQAREDFSYLLDPLDRAGRPVREFVERLIAAAVRP